MSLQLSGVMAVERISHSSVFRLLTSQTLGKIVSSRLCLEPAVAERLHVKGEE